MLDEFDALLVESDATLSSVAGTVLDLNDCYKLSVNVFQGNR